MAFQITYSVVSADLSELHLQFEKTLDQVRKNLGQEFPAWIGKKAYESGNFLENRNPARTFELLGKFHTTPTSEIDFILDTAISAQKIWCRIPWKERVTLLQRAADLILDRRLEIAAVLCLEAGKNRLESLGDVEEAAALFRYYSSQMEENNGFLKPLQKLSPHENTRSLLRPYGAFVVIAPFNFPLALAAGMAGAALLGGNSVILKPSSETPWCTHYLFECLKEAGLPAGVIQIVYGSGSLLGEALVKHPKTSGIAFTGSKEIGLKLMNSLSTAYPKPALLEMGGKNAAIICQSANLEDAVEGCVRSAFGLTGQKCSALSRTYVHQSIRDQFLFKLVEKTQTLKIGDPTLKDTFMGPLINSRAVNRHKEALETANKDGKIFLGHEELALKGDDLEGHFVTPAIVELPEHHPLSQNELFTPFLIINTFENLEEAIRESSNSQYGLTAGIFSESKEDVEYFMENMEAGVLYSNRKTGATTGAWPGVQSFCGWKGSGSTGKGGCGPYYVSQFMREQSQTRMEN